MSVAAESIATSSSPWWWTHCSVEDAAEPLDPTADDAAADCLASITAQTAQHTLTHAELLRPYLTHPLADAAAAAAELYDQLKFDALLVPLLGQLRKAMARAWEERAAEQAEVAAGEAAAPRHLCESVNNNSSSNAVSSPSSPLPPASTQESVMAAVCADPVLLRRLRVVQQQVYLAFFKVVLQGLTSGIRAAVSLYEADDSTRAVQTDGDEAKKGRAHEAGTSDRVARGVALLLDGFFARLTEAAISGSTASNTLTSAPAGAHKSRRGHHTSNSFSSSPSASDWFTGMMPLYTRAAQRSVQEAEGETGNEEAHAVARPPIPSPALCLVSYVGMFLQGAGLQLLASEQAAQLPLFTAVVHRVFLSQLAQRCEAVVSSSPSSPPTKAVRSAAAALAHIKSASRFLQHLTDAQLYCEEHSTEIADDDCTAMFHASPSFPLPSVTGTKTATESGAVVVDYSVASLLVLTTYHACSPILSALEKWWTACRRSLSQARADVVAQGSSTDHHESEKEGQDASMKQAELERGAAILKDAEDAWVLVRRHAMVASAIFSNYAETTLLLVPYAALLARLFYSPSVEDEEKAEPSLDAWKACIRELHHVTRAIYSDSSRSHSSSGSSSHGIGTPGGSAGGAAAAVSARPLRPHYRDVGNYTFAVASYLRVPTVLSDAAARVVLNRTEGSHPTCSADITPEVLPLAFSLLQQPLTVLQDRVLNMLITPGAVMSQLKADAMVGETSSVAEKSATSPSAAAVTTSAAAVSSTDSANASPTSARARAAHDRPMTAAEIVELSFPRHYRLLHAIDLAMQYSASRAQELAEATATEAWVSADSLPSLFACFFGAAMDEAFVVRLRDGNGEVCGSELLMFYAAVFRTLARDAFPSVRAALATFLGHAGVHLLEYLRHHIVDQQRHGLAAFFLPPLRALGLDYSTVEDTDISLALAVKPSYAPAMAYFWELPRLFFWKHDDTPAAEVAWRAHVAAQQYLCELMAQATPAKSSFLEIVAEASETAHRRCGKTGGSGAKERAPSTLQVAATDAMIALFLGVCRWCAAQLSGLAGTSSPSSVLPRESVSAALAMLCAPRGTAAATAAPLHPFLMSLQVQLREISGEADEEQAGTEVKSGGVTTETSAEQPATSPPPSTFSSHAVAWLWGCSYHDVAPAHLQTCAKRLLRDFSSRFGQHAPIKTVLGIRAVVEQRMKTEEAADAAAALQKLRCAVDKDVNELLVRQQKREQQEAMAKTAAKATTAAAAEEAEQVEESTMKHKTNAVNGTPQKPDVTVVVAAEVAAAPPATSALASPLTAPAPTLAPTELRGYVDQLLSALVTRARLSPVDGAISAAALTLFIRALSDVHLPIQMTPQDRQRMCERFVFSLTSMMPDLTRAEALSCACSLRLVLGDVVLPFKKSFLETTPSLRVFHGCLSDNEADAFKMVQHTLGDVVTAFQKCQEDGGSATLLSDWKAALLLEQAVPYISLVRSLLEKIRVITRKTVLKRKGHCVELLHQQLARMEKEATREGCNVADDVFHLFTHHPPPPPARPASAVAPAAATTATSPSTGKHESTADELHRRAKRKRGGRREKELKSDVKPIKMEEARGSNSGGNRQNISDEHRKRDEVDDGLRRRSERKRDRGENSDDGDRRDANSRRGHSARGRSRRHRR
ncbi:hypothetical protein ABL78_0885 [Leptomonas seymouri]|uniref:Uncharacterized protein n=1 Tax=Leptomonas seymouri TaxID=5684 RepID=A0A0N1PEA7_LEPSE|nr:hypothetical protein ABL78_0885 [Leptomonas seymouri]|eukprot:KPI90025.1 hypothetical protein ABL78_0885 [Leptomonas seymouri]